MSDLLGLKDEVLHQGHLGLLCNQTAFDLQSGEYLFQALARRGVLQRRFLPEHGLFAELQDQVPLTDSDIYTDLGLDAARFIPRLQEASIVIKHIVMWRLKEEAAGQTKAENARAIKTRLEALPQAIPQIRRLEVGLNVKESERAADVVLCNEFDSPEDLATYSNHPVHQEVVAFIREVAAETRVVDYEA